MTTCTLTYFDFHGGRGEDCRIALHAAGVDFEDDRVSKDWGARKAGTPFGSLPVFSRGGRSISDANAILALIGRENGMHPSDLWEAARHESIMGAAEDLRHVVEWVMAEKDPDQRKVVRKAMAAGALQDYGRRFSAQLADTGFLGGDALFVADLKLFVVMKWFRSGGLDHVPTTVFDGFPKLTAHYNAVAAHPAVVSWYASKGVTL